MDEAIACSAYEREIAVSSLVERIIFINLFLAGMSMSLVVIKKRNKNITV